MSLAWSLRRAGVLAAALAWGAAAHADTTLSGAIDVYLDWTRSPAGHLARLDSNTYGNTSVRLRSTDELPAGSKLTLVCQAGLYADTGQYNADNPCYLSISGRLGSGAFGEQYTPHAEALSTADAFGSSFWGTPYAIFVSGVDYLIRPGAISVDTQDALDERVRISAMFVPMRDPDDARLTSRGQEFVALHLKPLPDAYLGLVGVHDPGAAGAGRVADTGLLAAAWSLGPWRLSGGAQVVRLRKRDVGVQRYRELTAGLKYCASTRDTLLANVAVSDDRSRPGRRSWMLGATWLLSLRRLTDLYVGVSRLTNEGGAALGFGQAVPANSRSDDLILGFRTKF